MCNLYVLDSRSYHTQSGSVFPVFPKSELSLFYIDYGRIGTDDDDIIRDIIQYPGYHPGYCPIEVRPVNVACSER